MSNIFAHLKVHTEFSLADSTLRLDAMLKKAQKNNIVSIALTDMCNLFAAIKFYKKALSYGIKPIFGVDINISTNNKLYSLVLLAENNKGYLNIVELISRAYLDVDRKSSIPSIPKEWLNADNMHGVIALSSGVSGELGSSMLESNNKNLNDILDTYLSIFGKQNFIIEIEKIGNKDEETYNSKAISLAKEKQLLAVATNNVRFLDNDGYEDHEIRVGIYDGYTLLDETRKSIYTENQYLKTADEMSLLFADNIELIENSIAIAKRCNVDFDLGKTYLPNFTIPETTTETKYLSELSNKGLEERFKIMLEAENKTLNDNDKQIYYDRLKIEIEVICQMGFAGYFFIVADFIQWAKNNDIPVGPGRGSGAGSLVAYVLKITDIDPMPYGLLFERFLNPERVSMPDFDIDFCIDGRDKVIEYVAQKYGHNSVSQIITYGTMSAKAVVRDVGRVLGQPYGLVDKIAKMIPNDLGIKLKDAYVEGTDLYNFAQEDEQVQTILQRSINLEGLTRNVGKHAAGVIISPSLLTDFSPIYCEKGSHAIVSQFDKKDIEEVGLIKFDFLGLRNLTIIKNTLKLINKDRSLNSLDPINLDLLNMKDKITFDLLKSGNTTGIFQLESSGMKELIKRLNPDSFEEIIALVALYRPGPLGSGMTDDFVNRKHGRQSIVYPHPDLELVLKETYGTILYQEQVMQIAQILANYSLGNADILRRAMGKKDPKEMAEQRIFFESGAAKNKINSKVATKIFDTMEEFANYGFNKSHSAAYALIAYQTAWLKANYPAAFMAALLSSDMDKTDKVINFIAEAKNMDIEIYAPHVNTSDYSFTINNSKSLYYGLGAIKGLGYSVIENIVSERNSHGEYKDLFDFCCRVDLKIINKRSFDALTYAGAFDGFCSNRSIVLQEIEKAIKYANQVESSTLSGQNDMFGLAVDSKKNKESSAEIKPEEKSIWTFKQLLQYEKQVLGMYFSGHVIDEYKSWLRYFNIKPLSKITPSHKKESKLLAGSVISIMKRRTKSGKTMGIITIDDGFERVEMVIFHELYDAVKNIINIDEVVVIEGVVTVDSYNDRLKINANSVKPINDYIDQNIAGIDCKVSINNIKDIVFLELINCVKHKTNNFENHNFRLTVFDEKYSFLMENKSLNYSIYESMKILHEKTDLVFELGIIKK